MKLVKLFPGLINYSYFELLLRCFWWGTNIFFRYTPRHIYFVRNMLLRLNGAKIGASVKIYPSVVITNPQNLYIADNVTIGPNVILYALGKIYIDTGTVISQYAHLCAGTHDYRSVNFELIKGDISIGRQVWVAADAFIGPNVSIGNYSVIAARSVVVRHVDNNVLVAGNPSKIIKRIN